MTQINWEHVEQWRDALESGKYKQGELCLRDKDDNFCCLGIACELAGIVPTGFFCTDKYAYDNNAVCLPDAGAYWLGTDDDPLIFGMRASHLNDTLNFTFEEIAGLLTIALIERDGIE